MNQAVAKERALLKLAKAINDAEAELMPLQVKLAKLRAAFRALARGAPGEDEGAACEEEEQEEGALPPPRSRAIAPARHAPQGRPEWLSLNDRILGYFAAYPGEHNVDAIAEGAKGANRQSLRAALTALFKEGRLARVGKGVYAVPSGSRPTLVIATRAARGHGA